MGGIRYCCVASGGGPGMGGAIGPSMGTALAMRDEMDDDVVAWPAEVVVADAATAAAKPCCCCDTDDEDPTRPKEVS